MTSDAPGAIVHDSKHSRFVLEEADGTAELVYRRNGSRLILVHTEVPAALGGRGLGGQLVRSAIEFGRTNHMTVVPWCPFARTWLEAHRDEVADVAIDWEPPAP